MADQEITDPFDDTLSEHPPLPGETFDKVRSSIEFMKDIVNVAEVFTSVMGDTIAGLHE